MNVSLEEAIDIYARASWAWFGPRAVTRTQDRIEMLRKTGDLDGVRVWERVKGAVTELNKSASGIVYDDEQRECA